MKKMINPWFLLACFFSFIALNAQNEAAKWRFGNTAGIDFMTNPPTNMSVANTFTSPGVTASVADANGNLLFYTNGNTIWTAASATMANGAGLMGNNANQTALILQQPGNSNLYYVFTIKMAYQPLVDGLYYSIVDMTLAGGQGSVTAKNVQLYAGTLCSKLSGTRNCNSTDYWVVAKECSNNNGVIWNGIYSFQSFSLSAGGVNPVASVSNFTYSNNTGSSYANAVKGGQMKISPDGKKLACANYAFAGIGYNSNAGSFEIYDFDNATGQVSNFAPLYMQPTSGVVPDNTSGWGVEFSPDASKLYGTLSNNETYTNGAILQWDLCQANGNNNALAATQASITTPVNAPINGYTSMQLAPNGKIYVCPYNVGPNALSVINFPNQPGAASGFNLSSQSVAPAIAFFILPNFIGSQFFMASSIPAYSLSLLSSPVGCQAFQFQSPLAVGASIGNCPSNTYTVQSLLWDFGDPASGSANTSSLSTPTHTYAAVGTYTVKLKLNFGCNGGSHMLTQTVSVVNPNFGSLAYTPSLACGSTNTGSATYLNQQNSGLTYTWTNGSVTYTTASVSGLSGGTWSAVVVHTISGCQFNNVFTIQQPLPLLASLSAAACFNSLVTVSASGGTAPFSYNWSNGSTSPTILCLNLGPATVNVTDANGCTVPHTFTIYSPPALAITDPTICLGSQITLTASGASSYTWSGGSVVSPVVTSTYSVMGESDGCYAGGMITVVVEACNNSISEFDLASLAKVFPNPSSGEFIIDSPAIKAQLTDATGRLVSAFEVNGRQRLFIQDPGVYFLSLGSSKGVRTVKLVVVK